MSDTTYGYLGMLLIALVAVKYQGLNTDLFHEHPTIMLLFLIATLTQVIALTELKLSTDQNNGRSPILTVVFHASGILANELLLLILINPLDCFIINITSILLAQVISYSYQYVSGRSVEQQNENEGNTNLEIDVIPDLEAAE